MAVCDQLHVLPSMHIIAIDQYDIVVLFALAYIAASWYERGMCIFALSDKMCKPIMAVEYSCLGNQITYPTTCLHFLLALALGEQLLFKSVGSYICVDLGSLFSMCHC